MMRAENSLARAQKDSSEHRCTLGSRDAILADVNKALLTDGIGRVGDS